jgi:hypothetical protein
MMAGSGPANGLVREEAGVDDMVRGGEGGGAGERSG